MSRIAPVVAFCALALFLSACDEDSPTKPNDKPPAPPAALTLELPDTITAGRAFTLGVEALDSDGARAADWSGTVTLSVSAGTISPATLTLDAGYASATATVIGAAGEVTITATAGSGPGAVAGSASRTVLSGNAPARLVIEPSSFLLTEAGDSAELRVLAFDAAGQPTTPPADVTWRSLRPDVIGVEATAAGGENVRVRGVAPSGSAQIVAEANGVVSEPALGLIAEPAGDAVLVGDSRVSGAIEPVDPTADYGPGWRYRARVSGPGLEVGKLIIGTGEAPLAGRIVEMAPTGSGDEHLLTLELVPLDELFASITIEEELPLVDAAELPPSRFGLRGPATPGAALDLRPRGPNFATFKVGPFTCETSGSGPSLDLDAPTPEVTPNLKLTFIYKDGELRQLSTTGTVTATFDYKPVLEVAFEGEIDCEYTVKTLVVPIGGPISAIIGAQVPIGVGLDLDAALEVAQVGFDVHAEASASVTLGVVCPPGGACSGLMESEGSSEAHFKPVFPDPTDQFRVKLGARAFAFAKLTLGSPLSKSFQYEMLMAKAGLEQTIDLATAQKQAEDTAYASGYWLVAKADVSPGKHLAKAIHWLKTYFSVDVQIDDKSVGPPSAAIADTLARSPSGTFTITPDTVSPGDSTQLGDMATFKVTLDSNTFLGTPSVDRVEFFWWKEPEDDGGSGGGGSGSGPTLQPGRPGCTEVPGGAGKTEFECQTDFLEEHVGPQAFYAFTHAKLFDVPLPVPLEVALDGKATVQVGDECRLEGGSRIVRLGLEEADPPAVRTFGKAMGEILHADVTHVAARTSSGEDARTSTQNVGPFVNIEDRIAILPEDPALIGTMATLRYSAFVSASVSVTSKNNAFAMASIDGTFFPVPFNRRDIWVGETTMGPGGYYYPATEYQIDTVATMPVVLGAPMRVKSLMSISASGKGGASGTASGGYRFELLGVVDGEGNDIPVRRVCSALGVDYGLPVTSATASNAVGRRPGLRVETRRRE